MDIKLNYIEKGAGFPFLFLHGNGENLCYFQHQIDYFSKSYRVIAIDTRGHGGSPRGASSFTIPQFAEDLLCFMEEHQLKKAHILGFSDGGNIALTFALKYPEHVEKLILNGANLSPSGLKKHVQIPIILEYHLASIFCEKSALAKKKAELLSLMAKEPNIQRSQLLQLRIPTLVIAGTKDMIREKHTKLIFECLPNAQLAIIPGDHFLANRQPSAFNARVAAFLCGELIQKENPDSFSAL